MSDYPFSLKGKTILVTGASSGIGKACAIEIARAEAKTCIITGRNTERLEETAKRIRDYCKAEIIKADFSDISAIETLAEEVGKLDGVVLSAGMNRIKGIRFVNEKDINDIFNVNCFSSIHLIRFLLKKKKLNNPSSVVVVSSISGSGNFAAGNSVYGASKSAITAYTKYAAVELASKGIRCNTIHPGRIETPLINSGIMNEEELRNDIAKYPLKRYGQPEEVAYAAIYLLSDAAAWVTGSEITIDGGRSLV